MLRIDVVPSWNFLIALWVQRQSDFHIFIQLPYLQLGTERSSVALLLWWPVCLLTWLPSRLMAGTHTQTESVCNTWRFLSPCWQGRQCFPCLSVWLSFSHGFSVSLSHTCTHVNMNELGMHFSISNHRCMCLYSCLIYLASVAFGSK